MKYLITGGSGFVGDHLNAFLINQKQTVISIDSLQPKRPIPGVIFHKISLTDQESLKKLLVDVQPERIIHLASASSVAYSWEEPVECFINNTNIFLNLVEIIRQTKIKCRILSVGSSEEYGIVNQQDLPIVEKQVLNPLSPYAVARVAQEQLSRIYAQGYGLDIICTRSFNHVGPGQSDRFVISSFVRQAVEVSLGKREGITCGNIDIIRDFLDVRDVVQAYIQILDKGSSGEVYNVCSGRGITLRAVLEIICKKANIVPNFIQDPQLIRRIDSPAITGNNEKLKSLGFNMAFDLENSLEDLVNYWKEALKTSEYVADRII